MDSDEEERSLYFPGAIVEYFKAFFPGAAKTLSLATKAILQTLHVVPVIIPKSLKLQLERGTRWLKAISRTLTQHITFPLIGVRYYVGQCQDNENMHPNPAVQPSRSNTTENIPRFEEPTNTKDASP